MGVRYLAPRLTSCELELDATPAQVLLREVLREPLSPSSQPTAVSRCSTRETCCTSPSRPPAPTCRWCRAPPRLVHLSAGELPSLSSVGPQVSSLSNLWRDERDRSGSATALHTSRPASPHTSAPASRRAALGLAPLRGPNGSPRGRHAGRRPSVVNEHGCTLRTPEGGTPAAEASLRCALPPARSGAVRDQFEAV